MLSEIIIRNFCACTQKCSTSLLRICVYTQKSQCWKKLLSEIINLNFCACTQKSSTSLLRICVYGQKIQQMIIIKSSNNPIVDVLRPAQKLQVWNTYIPGWSCSFRQCVQVPKVLKFFLLFVCVTYFTLYSFVILQMVRGVSVPVFLRKLRAL